MPFSLDVLTEKQFKVGKQGLFVRSQRDRSTSSLGRLRITFEGRTYENDVGRGDTDLPHTAARRVNITPRWFVPCAAKLEEPRGETALTLDESRILAPFASLRTFLKLCNHSTGAERTPAGILYGNVDSSCVQGSAYIPGSSRSSCRRDGQLSIVLPKNSVAQLDALPHGGETGDPRINPPTNGIVRYNTHMRKSGVTRPGIESGSPRWELSSLTAQPPWPQFVNECTITQLRVLIKSNAATTALHPPNNKNCDWKPESGRTPGGYGGARIPRDSCRGSQPRRPRYIAARPLGGGGGRIWPQTSSPHRGSTLAHSGPEHYAKSSAVKHTNSSSQKGTDLTSGQQPMNERRRLEGTANLELLSASEAQDEGGVKNHIVTHISCTIPTKHKHKFYATTNSKYGRCQLHEATPVVREKEKFSFYGEVVSSAAMPYLLSIFNNLRLSVNPKQWPDCLHMLCEAIGSGNRPCVWLLPRMHTKSSWMILSRGRGGISGQTTHLPPRKTEFGSLPGRSREWRRMMALIGRFSRGYPVAPTLPFRHCFILTSLHPSLSSPLCYCRCGCSPSRTPVAPHDMQDALARVLEVESEKSPEEKSVVVQFGRLALYEGPDIAESVGTNRLEEGAA
ncbi:hypothetical protein PR048_023324 [Dryococelus australis]|uniref:Uncharacterized protein n=1 Tax=Dryococelus australis TaxID=614101 RepID=A0ABQ9GTV3_9NEOP|nr:hypothetical protein PR048_023324 [Dryococelus australis]